MTSALRLAKNVTVLLALAVIPSTASAQMVRLTRANATTDEAFSFVRGVRELPDGRVLVADYIDQSVVVVNFGTGQVRELMREGEGPSEVRLPYGITPGRADSSYVIDYGNNRLSVLAPDGRAVRTITLQQPGRLFTRGFDATGAMLYAVPAWAERENALPNDSVRIVRWRPPSEETSVAAVIQGNRARRDRSPSMEPRIPIIGFAAQDAWLISSEGELVIVRNTPYRLEFIEPSGRVRRGSPLAVAPREVTLADKRRYVIEFNNSSPMSGRGPDGGMGRPPVLSTSQVASQVEITEWATHHPPFDAGGVHAAPGGRTWVRRSSDPTIPAQYDVFDRTGARVQEIELPRGRRLALVGARWLYVVAESEDGVQALERYALPN